MRRWNGWGDETVHHPIRPEMAAVLEELVGPASAPRDASLPDVAGGVPPSRLPPHPLVSTDPVERVLHARGQGFPDLVALRGGDVPAFPDGVALPADAGEVRELLRFAAEAGARVIPYGGGTGVAGQACTLPGPVPVLVLALRRLDALLHLDAGDRLATFGAGATGPQVEARLRAHGLTLGHFPQSFERSTLGGWIATRSSGQEALGYGRMERLFAGGVVEAPAGTLRIPPFPASAAGPDLREMVLGSEGRLGVITEAVVRVSPAPERERVEAVFFRDWGAAREALRALARSGLPLTMLRLSAPSETATEIALLRGRPAGTLLRGFLALRRVRGETCRLLIGLAGEHAQVTLTRSLALTLARRQGGVHAGARPGAEWTKRRFRGGYLRDELWALGYGVDSVETATRWSGVAPLVEALEGALTGALAGRGERVHPFTHLSQPYPDGSNVYTTFLFRLGEGPHEALDRWRTLKEAASRAIVAHGGTISHQHGVGTDHLPYLEAEKGPLGLEAIRRLAATFDPHGLLNPGKLVRP